MGQTDAERHGCDRNLGLSVNGPSFRIVQCDCAVPSFRGAALRLQARAEISVVQGFQNRQVLALDFAFLADLGVAAGLERPSELIQQGVVPKVATDAGQPRLPGRFVLQCLTAFLGEFGMGATVTIRLEEALQARLSRLSDASGRTRSDLVREALERQLALIEFSNARRKTRPFAERAGWLTDDDVFDAVS